MRATLILAGLASALVATAPANASAAAEAFAAGRWAEAAALGSRGTTAADRIAEARALSVIATWETKDKAKARAQLEQAVRAAEAAVALDPANNRALLERAIVVGYLGKLKGSAGDAKASRRDAEEVLRREPKNALAEAILGGWHLETVATVGAFLARTAVGARAADGVRHFDRALGLDPASVLYPVFYAFALLSLDYRNAPKAAELLVTASRNTPRDAYERQVQARGRQVLDVLQKGQPQAGAALAKRLSPLGQIES